jgi:hypothetical protein
MWHINRFVAVGVAAVCGPMLATTAAVASPDQEVFDKNDTAWACEAEGGLPPAHCINVQSEGNTGVIKVFEPDERWPQESISFDPKSDTRPCPHDPDATDGTWWSPFSGAWVCHHRP